jgi:hypothetical protein
MWTLQIRMFYQILPKLVYKNYYFNLTLKHQWFMDVPNKTHTQISFLYLVLTEWAFVFPVRKDEKCRILDRKI